MVFYEPSQLWSFSVQSLEQSLKQYFEKRKMILNIKIVKMYAASCLLLHHVMAWFITDFKRNGIQLKWCQSKNGS